MNMTKEEFLFDMEHGGEMEFNIFDEQYFLQPDYEKYNPDFGESAPPYSHFYLYRVRNGEEEKMLHGTASDIFDYVFYESYTLKRDFEIFSITRGL